MEAQLIQTFSNPMLLYLLETHLSLRGLKNHLSLWGEMKYLQFKELMGGSHTLERDLQLVHHKYLINGQFSLGDNKLESLLKELGGVQGERVMTRINDVLKLTMAQMEDRLKNFFADFATNKLELKLNNNLLVDFVDQKHVLKGGPIKEIIEALIIFPGEKKQRESDAHKIFFFGV